jgi:hypothetical protein
MSDGPPDEELARLADQHWAAAEKALPFGDFLKTWAPLNWATWVRVLDKDPVARERVRELGGEAALTSGLEIPQKAWKGLRAFIREHPQLLRRAQVEHRLQVMCTMRTALFAGNLPAPERKSAEWKALFDRLTAVLQRHGKGDAFGEGDFFLVDDEVGEPAQKIELQNPDVLTPTLIADLQAELKGWRNDWYVVITLHFEDVDPQLDPGMLVVWADHVDEALDREQYGRLLGPRFKL